MKKIIKIISILFVLIVSNNLNAMPPGTTFLKACTVHGKIYETILMQEACSGEPPVGFEYPAYHPAPTVHAHDPECFSFHRIFESIFDD